MNTDTRTFMLPFINEVIAARRAVKAYFQKRVNQIDSNISYEMFQVLVVLWGKNQVNQQEIANTVQKGKASVTPLVDKLAHLKLVTRTEDASDRRNKIISLTKQGRHLEKKFESTVTEFCNIFKADVSEKMIKEMTKLLSKMTEKIVD